MYQYIISHALVSMVTKLPVQNVTADEAFTSPESCTMLCACISPDDLPHSSSPHSLSHPLDYHLDACRLFNIYSCCRPKAILKTATKKDMYGQGLSPTTSPYPNIPLFYIFLFFFPSLSLKSFFLFFFFPPLFLTILHQYYFQPYSLP